MAQLRIKFHSTAFITADTLEECKKAWEKLDLNINKKVNNAYCEVEYDELLYVTDGELNEINIDEI